MFVYYSETASGLRRLLFKESGCCSVITSIDINSSIFE